MYDRTTGYWLSPKYMYDKRLGWYEIVPLSAAQPDYLVTAPSIIHTAFGDLVVGSPDWQLAKLMGILDAQGQPTGQAAATNLTGSGSTNHAAVTTTNQSWFDLTNLVNVINTLQSVAHSGDVTATGNTRVGDATSGAAMVLANLINLLASAWSWSNGDLSFFMQNFFGNNTGDIMLQPTAATGGGGALGAGSTQRTTTNTLGVNAQTVGSITNNVDLTAQSGNATASGNSQAGNVTSGSAYAEANIINLINSFIVSGNSFFGILNIFGNLNGDLLFPEGFLNAATPSSNNDPNGGSGPNSANQISGATTNTLNLDATTAYGISNNVMDTATSGAGSSASNSASGSVGSGAANTSSGLFNLANTQIFGDNAVLVIVNVMGHWVGKIMNLAGGRTEAALLTGNAQTTSLAAGSGSGSGSNNSAGYTTTNQASIHETSAGTIANNVRVTARSGDAAADHNTSVGNVTSGTAQAASNVANIVNSALNVRHWFGVLVINVFGDWFGSVGQNTAAGQMALGLGAGAGAGRTAANPAAPLAVVAQQAMAALAPAVASGTATGAAASQPATNSASARGAGAVLAATHAAAPLTAAAAAHPADLSWLFGLSAVLLLLAGAAMQLERWLRRSPRP